MQKDVVRQPETHKFLKELKESGFMDEQAKIIIKAIKANNGSDFSKLVNHDQLKVLEERLKGIVSEAKYDILKWMIPLLLTIIGLIATMMFKMFGH